MAIITQDGALAGMRPPETILKVGTAPEVAGVYHSHFYATGRPGAATAPSPGLSGTALTSYAGQIPWVNPASGNSYLARFNASASVACKLLLCDRLWHNSGMTITSTGSQTINSVTWPARDRDGSTNGEGVLVGLEFSAAGGAGTPTCTLGYTNQAGTAGKTNTFLGIASSNIGTFYIWPLAAGDTGVRSVQTYQQSATWTSGTIHLVAFRIIATVCLPIPNVGNYVSMLDGFQRLYDNTVPFIIQVASATTATNIIGQMIVTQG